MRLTERERERGRQRREEKKETQEIYDTEERAPYNELWTLGGRQGKRKEGEGREEDKTEGRGSKENGKEENDRNMTENGP